MASKMEYIPGFSGNLNCDSQLGQLFSIPSQRNFLISFKPMMLSQSKIFFNVNVLCIDFHSFVPDRNSKT